MHYVGYELPRILILGTWVNNPSDFTGDSAILLLWSQGRKQRLGRRGYRKEGIPRPRNKNAPRTQVSLQVSLRGNEREGYLKTQKPIPNENEV
jgi:hypothetical protein